MALVKISSEVYPIISLEEAKAHLRVEFSDDDTLITSMLLAAMDHAEQFMGRSLVDTTWDLHIDSFPKNDKFISLMQAPIIDSVGVFYFVDDTEEEEFEGVLLDRARSPGRIILGTDQSWPTTRAGLDSVRIRFRAGYINMAHSPPSGEVPSSIIAAIKLILGTLYANREDVLTGAQPFKMPWGAENLLRMYRCEVALA